jgi:hypothetical protein
MIGTLLEIALLAWTFACFAAFILIALAIYVVYEELRTYRKRRLE